MRIIKLSKLYKFGPDWTIAGKKLGKLSKIPHFRFYMCFFPQFLPRHVIPRPMKEGDSVTSPGVSYALPNRWWQPESPPGENHNRSGSLNQSKSCQRQHSNQLLTGMGKAGTPLSRQHEKSQEQQINESRKGMICVLLLIPTQRLSLL